MNLTSDSRAAELHKRAIIIDGHSDVLMPIADGRMRLGDRFDLPEPSTWIAPPGWTVPAEMAQFGITQHSAYFQTMGHYDLPRFREGGLTAQSMAVFIDESNLDRSLQRALEMIYWLDREFADNPDFVPVLSGQDIRRAKQEGKIGGILTFEGFEPMGTNLHLLDLFYRLGLRIATLTHSRRNYFADGTQPGITTTGLSAAGREAVKRIDELGIVVDLAHLAPAGCFDVFEISQRPIISSHASPRYAFRSDPSGGPEMVKRVFQGIADSGGVIGMIAYAQPSLQQFLDDIDTTVAMVGAEHVGLGSDFFGIEVAPVGFTSMAELPAVTAGLVERGYSDEEILGILGGNFLRVFDKVWR